MKLSKLIRIVSAIVFTSGILLLLDMGNRQSAAKSKIPEIAIFKIISRKVIDETENGVIEALAKRGDWRVSVVNPIGVPPLALGRPRASLRQSPAAGGVPRLARRPGCRV